MSCRAMYLRILILAALSVGITSRVSALIIIPFASAYGNGLVTQDSYHEPADVDSFGLSYPVTSWYTWPGPAYPDDVNYHLTVDTDYGTGYFTVGYTVYPYYEIQVYIY